MGRKSQFDLDHWSQNLPTELLEQGLKSFDALWKHELAFIESPNEDRGGRSGVGILDLGRSERFFLKRQEAHMTRSSRFPFSKIPTFEREFQAISLFQSLGLSCPEALYFGRRGNRAILLTRELACQGSLADVAPRLHGQDRRRLLEVLAGEIRRIHDAGLKHGSLYPKHIFILRLEPMKIGFIDLEKAKHSYFKKRTRVRDLDALNRRTQGFRRSERFYFLLRYCRGDRELLKGLWQSIGLRAERRAS